MRSSRRQLIAAAGLATLAGCGGAEERPRPPADLGVLGPLLELERACAAWYAAAERAAGGRQRELFGALRAHEDEHVLGIEQALRDLGTEPGAAAARPAEPRPGLRAAARMEERAIATQARALGALRSADLRATVASMIVAQAGHLAVLRALAGDDPLGNAS